MTAVITGASSGIGGHFAQALARRGHDIVVVARRGDRLEALAREIDAVGVEPLVADLSSRDDLARVAERVARDDVEMLVNNAGVAGYAPFAHADPAVLERVMLVNEVAPTLLARAAIPGFVERDRGAIVNVASMLAFSGGAGNGRLPLRATYAATKAHLVAFTRVLAGELERTGVRVQVCCPGYTASEFHVVEGAEPAAEEQLARLGPEPHAMSAADVVAASLRALDAGEVVCVPGLEDPERFDDLAGAERALRRATSNSLAARYAP